LSILLVFCSEGVIKLPFKKNIPNLSDLSPEDLILKGIQHNQIITEINIGTEPQKIPMLINLHFYDFFIAGEEENIKQKPFIVFKESNSTTFNKLEAFGTYGARGFTLGYKANDYYTVNNQKYNISFILASDPDDNVSGLIGLKINEEEDKEIIEYNFIYQLKKAKIIKDYYFSIKYTDNSTGYLIIGDLPGNYDDAFRNIEYKDTYVNNPDSPTSWNMKIDSIYTKSSKNEKKKDLGNYIIYFRNDLGLTIGSEEYRKEFLESFMLEQIEKDICRESFAAFYYIYYCNNTVDFSKMDNLYFYNKELNFSFEFTYKDLFFYNELDNKYYFLIEFEKNTGKYSRWLIGEFFFKKYQLFFNQEKKKIGIYTGRYINENIQTKNESWLNSNKWYLILIIFLFLLMIALGIVLYLYIRNKPRKKKANELVDDMYDYTINNENK
jgi:hypothetical protein